MTRRVPSQLDQVERLDKLDLNDEIDMEEQSVLERLTDVYRESVTCLSKAEETATGQLPIVPINHQPTVASIEIDGNYLLYFNEIHRSRVRTLFKKILRKLTWSILKRQVYFNSAIRDTVYKLMQKDYEFSLNHIRVQAQVSELEQQVQQLSKQVEQLSALNQQAMKLLTQIAERQPELRGDLKQLVDDRESNSLSNSIM